MFYKKIISTLPAIAVTCISLSVSAQELPRDPVIVDCRVTPSVQGAANGYPGDKNIIHSNKLYKPAGKSIPTEGQYLQVIGRVTDENCVPVAGAVIDLWQTGIDGKYTKPSVSEMVSPFPVFAGNGRATTDNMGYFRFDTIFPGTYEKRAPHVHLRIAHKDFGVLATEMFFAGDQRNEGDKILKTLASDKRDRLMGEVGYLDANNPDAGLKVQYDIALKGKNPFRRF